MGSEMCIRDSRTSTQRAQRTSAWAIRRRAATRGWQAASNFYATMTCSMSAGMLVCVLTAVSVRRGYCAPHACGTTPVRWLSRHLSSQTQACGCADLCAVFLVSFLVRLLTLAEREALEDVPNTLAYQEAIETDAAAYLSLIHI